MLPGVRPRSNCKVDGVYQEAIRTLGGGATARLSLAQALAPPAPPPLPRASRLAAIDFAPDLGTDIGSRRWWRGLATLGGLFAALWALSPGIRPVMAQTVAPVSEATRAALNAQAITPLALGADTGRRMGATAAVRPLTDRPERPRVELTATLGRSDSFARVLERAGVGGREAGEAERLVAGAIDPALIRPGTRMDLVLGRRAAVTDARPLESLFFRADLGLALAVQRSGEGLALVPTRIPVDAAPLRVSGVVGDSFYRSARAAGVPADVAQTALRVFGGTLASSDRFDLVIDQRRAATGEVEFGALQLAGLWRDGRAVNRIRWTVDGREGWADEASLTRPRGRFVQPVQGYRTSGYGLRRHPILGYVRMHAGVDFAAAYGSPIHAASDGVVVSAGWHGGHGRYVRLGHADGVGTGYAHMSRIAVAPGMRVQAGQVIGYVGSTGLSTGPHLHYEVYRGGATVNPDSVSFLSRPVVDAGEIARFRARVRNLLGR